MDNSGQYSRNRLEEQIKEWRERRVQKMALRLQLHSDKPRTISASVLGYGYQRDVTMQPFPIHDPRNNHTGRRHWNSNNSTHNVASQQYETGRGSDHRWGHGSFQQNRQKKVHFTSHKSLHEKSKSTNVLYRKFSSCSNISGLREVETARSSCHTVPPSSEAVSTSSATVATLDAVSHLTVIAGEGSESSSCPDIANPTTTLDVGIVDQNLNCNTTNEVCDKAESSGSLNETFTISMQSELIDGDSELPDQIFEDYVPDLNDNVIACSSFTDEVVIDEDGNNSEQNSELTDEKATTLSIEVVSDDLANSGKLNGSLSSEPISSSSECSGLINMESASEDLDVEPIVHIEKKSISSLEHDSLKVDDSQLYIDAAVDNEVEISFSYEPDVEVIEEDSSFVLCDDYSVPDQSPDFAVDTEPGLQNLEENEARYGTSGGENAEVVPVTWIVTSDELIGSSKVVKQEKCDMAQEIEDVENQFANISITHKDDIGSNDCMTTPMKRERKKALLDATNILPSSAIKYSVREFRKKGESEIIVTPVRRSIRASSVTPICRRDEVQTLEELSPEIRQKMKYKPNPAIDIGDC